MIVKELDPLLDDGIYSRAGYQAEQQMAFYLKRCFETDPRKYVINNLRLQRGADDFVQMDHVVVHTYGMIIIESKSVSSKVKINEHREWMRLWDGHWKGMPSPVKQGERQADALREILAANQTTLLGKFLGVQRTFKNIVLDVIVAISDQAVVQRADNVMDPNICKADQVCDRIKAIIAEYEKKDLAIVSLGMPFWFTRQAKERVVKWLLAMHKPLAQMDVESAAQPQPAYPLAATQPDHVAAEAEETYQIEADQGNCEQCGQAMTLLVGRYGPYWRCEACQKNQAIRVACPSCNQRMTVRQDGEQFYILCESCKVEGLFHDAATGSAEPAIEPSAAGVGSCCKCGAHSEICWGKYGYYWKCPSCATNTAIKEFCQTCKTRLKVHKNGSQYTTVCSKCQTEQAYYTVPV